MKTKNRQEKDLLDLSKKISEICNDLDCIFGSCELLSSVAGDIWDLIFKEYGIDPDNELFVEALFKFETGEITKAVLLKKINKWKIST